MLLILKYRGLGHQNPYPHCEILQLQAAALNLLPQKLWYCLLARMGFTFCNTVCLALTGLWMHASSACNIRPNSKQTVASSCLAP